MGSDIYDVRGGLSDPDIAGERVLVGTLGRTGGVPDIDFRTVEQINVVGDGMEIVAVAVQLQGGVCLLYTSPSPRD